LLKQPLKNLKLSSYFQKKTKTLRTRLTRSKVLKDLLKDFYSKSENKELDIINKSENENFKRFNNINKSKFQDTEKLDIIFFNPYLDQEYSFPAREEKLDSNKLDIEIELEKPFENSIYFY
jgi:hypothetical protein